MTRWPVNSLQFTSISDILSAYLEYAEGGHSVSYGRLLDSRGGSTEAQVTSRHCSAALEREEATGLQSSRLMAYQSKRATGLDGEAEQQREVTALAISPVAPSALPELLHGASNTPLGDATCLPFYAHWTGGVNYRAVCFL